jgi:hypothetical protein
MKKVVWELSLGAFVNGACRHWLGYNPLEKDNAPHVIVSNYFGERGVQGNGNSGLFGLGRLCPCDC